MATARVPVPGSIMAIGHPVEVAAEIPEATRRRWLAAVGEFCRKRPLGAIGAAVVVVNILVGAEIGRAHV